MFPAESGLVRRTDSATNGRGRAWAAGALAAVVVVCAARFAFGGAALEADPAVLSGSLHNGLSYHVQQRVNAPGNGVAVRLHIAGGTLDEREAERGAAHVVSRLIFQRSARFETGEARRQLGALGTNFTRGESIAVREGEIVYSFDVQRSSERALDLVLRISGDVLDGLVFEAGVVEKERRQGINDAQLYRSDMRGARDELFERLLPGSGLSERPRFPDPEMIERVGLDALRAYHARVFDPARATVVVVGDVEPVVVAEQIEAVLGGVERRGEAGGSPEWMLGGFASSVMSSAYPGHTDATVELLVAQKPADAVTTRKAFARAVQRELAVEAMRVRLRRLMLDGDIHARDVGANTWEIPGAMRLTGISATTRPGRWAASATALVREVERVRKYGFAPIDLVGARSRVVSFAEERMKSAASRSNARAAAEILGKARMGSTVISAADAYELTAQVASLTDDSMVGKTFAEVFAPGAWCTLVVAPPESAPGEDQLARIVESAKRSAGPDVESGALSLPSLEISQKYGVGAVESISFDPLTGISTAVFANGVTAHHKRLETAVNRAAIGLALVGGRMQENERTRGATSAVASIWDAPVWCGTSIAAVDAALAGRGISFESYAYSDALQLTAMCPSDEVEAALRVVESTIREPLIDARSLDRWREGVGAAAARRRTEPGRMLNEVFNGVVHPSGDPRFGMLGAEDAARVDIELAQRWADELLDAAPIELVVVGDIERVTAFDRVGATRGTPPPRARVGAGGVVSDFSSDAVEGAIEAHATSDPGADYSIVLSGYRGAPYADRAQHHRLGVIRHILEARIGETLQEREQLASWVGGGIAPGLTHELSGMVWIAAAVGAEELEATGHRLLDAFGELAAGDVSEEELSAAKQLALRDVRAQLDDPAHWARFACDMRYRGFPARDEVRAGEIIEATDGAGIREVLGQLRRDERRIVITIQPEERN